jgi:coenzyme F420-reducing hydrogenase alpha subunit
MESLRSEVSENHRRALSVRLRILEESALALMELFRAVDSTFTERDALPEERAGEAETLVAELQSRISRMKSELGLERTRVDAKRYANALVVAMSVNVEELHPDYLKGYGAVPEDLAKYLKLEIHDLLQLMQRLGRVLRTEDTEVRPGG